MLLGTYIPVGYDLEALVLDPVALSSLRYATRGRAGPCRPRRASGPLLSLRWDATPATSVRCLSASSSEGLRDQPEGAFP